LSIPCRYWANALMPVPAMPIKNGFWKSLSEEIMFANITIQLLALLLVKI